MFWDKSEAERLLESLGGEACGNWIQVAQEIEDGEQNPFAALV